VFSVVFCVCGRNKEELKAKGEKPFYDELACRNKEELKVSKELRFEIHILSRNKEELKE